MSDRLISSGIANDSVQQVGNIYKIRYSKGSGRYSIAGATVSPLSGGNKSGVIISSNSRLGWWQRIYSSWRKSQFPAAYTRTDCGLYTYASPEPTYPSWLLCPWASRTAIGVHERQNIPDPKIQIPVSWLCNQDPAEKTCPTFCFICMCTPFANHNSKLESGVSTCN